MAKRGPKKTDLTERKEFLFNPSMVEQLEAAALIYGSQGEVVRRALTFFFASIPSVTMNSTKQSKEAA